MTLATELNYYLIVLLSYSTYLYFVFLKGDKDLIVIPAKGLLEYPNRHCEQP
ncbi:MAG: hypothetical protein AB8U78_01000 [Rickettsia slovaca]|uniref:hypothetical protein n=1 Tax=Rickettsia slovaca TaxID=35794 RepID=UPI0003093C02|nr:hypothetical protein [Rickettsia slovaca]